jgi:hypothetical protein
MLVQAIGNLQSGDVRSTPTRRFSMYTNLHHLSRFLIVGCLLLLLAGCKSKVTKANFDKITEGMELADVEKILGRGTKLGDGVGTANQFGIDLPVAKSNPNTEIYTWETDSLSISIPFVSGKVKNPSFRERR